MKMYYCMSPAFLAFSHISNILLVGSSLLLMPQIILLIEKYYRTEVFILKENYFMRLKYCSADYSMLTAQCLLFYIEYTHWLARLLKCSHAHPYCYKHFPLPQPVSDADLKIKSGSSQGYQVCYGRYSNSNRTCLVKEPVHANNPATMVPNELRLLLYNVTQFEGSLQPHVYWSRRMYYSSGFKNLT